MDGPEFYAKLRVQNHDRGEGFLIPNPRFKDDEIARRAMACRDVIYTTVVQKAEIKAKADRLAFYSPICCNRLAKEDPAASSGQPVPLDFYRLLMGFRASPYQYVLPVGTLLGGAQPDGDAIWVSGGQYRGTADSCVYYARPSSIIGPNEPEFDDFPDGFYEAVITHTAIELVMGESQDAADRLGNLNELLMSQLEGLV